MGDPERLMRSRDGSVTPDYADLLRLPTPGEPLRKWTAKEVGPSAIIAAIETLMQVARARPDFEARRLARKTAIKFRY